MDNVISVGEEQRGQKHKGRRQNGFFKSEARRVLFASDNLYKSVMSYFICGLMSGLPLYMSFYVPGLFEIWFSESLGDKAVKALSDAAVIILYIIFSFLLFTFFLGAYTLAAKMKDEPDTEPGAPVYSSLETLLNPAGNTFCLRRTVILYIILAAELSLSVLPSVFVIKNISLLGAPVAVNAVICTAVCVLSAFASLFFISLLAPLPYVIADNGNIGAVAAYSKSVFTAMRGIRVCFSLFISFIPLMIISALTFGMLFFAYTLPYMSLSFAKAGEYLYNLQDPERKQNNG